MKRFLPSGEWRRHCVVQLFAVALLASMTAGVNTASAQLDDDDDWLFVFLPGILGKGTASGPVPTRPTAPPVEVPGEVTGSLSIRRTGDRLFVTSTQEPGWRVEFAVGGPAPGGGTAIGLYIPANSTDSVVESRPFRQCCSGLGLDNLEWRHRPFGGSAGVRAAIGHGATVSRFVISENTPQRVVFTLTGSWPGVRQFTRRTIVTPLGFTTVLNATYSGTTGRDSMWWLPALFHEDRLLHNQVTIEDENTQPIALRKTLVGTRIPDSISFPYTIRYPLTSPTGHSISMTMSRLADTSNAGRLYEYFDAGNPSGINIGPYYLIYPRWTSVFSAKTYSFVYSWKFTEP